MLLVATALLGLHLRATGVFRGLQDDSVFHPDEPKQVSALFNYLHGRYIWYTGSLFYDGYPYGLNHVDEWLIRPFLLIRDACMATCHGSDWTSQIPSRTALYYWARTLRVLYGIVVMLVAYAIARRLFRRPADAWLVLLLTAIAPLSFCVTHFATGDIGVDLFGGIALLLLVVFARREHYLYVLGAGFATGMAFGCKYNGLLCGIAIALFGFLNLASNRRVRTFFATAVTSIAGCTAGILVSTPVLLLSFYCTAADGGADGLLRKPSASDRNEGGPGMSSLPPLLHVRLQERNHVITQGQGLDVPALPVETDALSVDIKIAHIRVYEFRHPRACSKKGGYHGLVPQHNERVRMLRRALEQRLVFILLQEVRLCICHLWRLDALGGIPGE